MADAAAAGKYEKLQEIIRQAGTAAIAVSGGVDSTLLARVAGDVLGRDRMLTVHVSTPLHAADELEKLKAVAQEIGGRLAIINVDPLAWPDFIANPPDRCYHCKKKIYALIRERSLAEGISTIMDGTNLDDLSDYRPGLKAIAEMGILTPLADAGLGKDEIRLLSRDLGLSNWNRPSASCLATRIPAGTEITRELLALVARGEEYLQALAFQGCRVRLAGDDVHIELAAGDFDRFVRDTDRAAVAGFFAGLGFAGIYLNILERKP